MYWQMHEINGMSDFRRSERLEESKNANICSDKKKAVT